MESGQPAMAQCSCGHLRYSPKLARGQFVGPIARTNPGRGLCQLRGKWVRLLFRRTRQDMPIIQVCAGIKRRSVVNVVS